MQEKAFASALGPSDLQPFYLKASEIFEQEDITLSTIVTSDRFPVLSRLATRYKGKKKKMTTSLLVQVNIEDSNSTFYHNRSNFGGDSYQRR